MLTIARMNAHSVAYYQSTVEENQGADSYYSEDGTKPAEVWIKAAHATNSTFVSTHLGVENGETVDGKSVHDWFDNAVAPSGGKARSGTRSRWCSWFRSDFLRAKISVVAMGIRR